MWDLTHKIGVPHRHEWFLIHDVTTIEQEARYSARSEILSKKRHALTSTSLTQGMGDEDSVGS